MLEGKSIYAGIYIYIDIYNVGVQHVYTKGAQVLNLYIFVYIHSYIYTHTHICIYIYMCVCVYVCMYVCMYVHIYVQTHISLYIYIYVHIHLHIRIYMNICNICNNHEYTMHPTSPEASNPFNSETPTPDLHRTSYKLDIHTLSYIYIYYIVCVYIYTYILEPYKILGRLELPGLGREVEGGILGAPRGLHALKRRTDGRVCVCVAAYIYMSGTYTGARCAFADEGRGK